MTWWAFLLVFSAGACFGMFVLALLKMSDGTYRPDIDNDSERYFQ